MTRKAEQDMPEDETENAENAPADRPELTPEDALEKIQALEEEMAQAKDQMLRAVAEADNARKRAERAQEDTAKYAVADFAKGLLSVSDNLRRAIESVPEDQRTAHELLSTLLDGIEATERELLNAFEKAGIQKIEPLGEVFNPNFHEVMFETEDPGQPAGTVLQILEPGYVIRDRLLRPARVGVAKGGDKPGKQVDEQA